MKKLLLPLLLLPCAAFAADDGGLSQCPRVFRDNMEIAVFTMPLSARQPRCRPAAGKNDRTPAPGSRMRKPNGRR